MRKLIAILLLVIVLLSGCAKTEGRPDIDADAEYSCSAWLCYWDAEAALREAREHPDAFASLICFEAFFDTDGNILLPPESDDLRQVAAHRRLAAGELDVERTAVGHQPVVLPPDLLEA